MAKLTKNGRKGQIRKRAQYLNTRTRRWVKIDTESGKILAVKSDKKPFKGVRKIS